MSRTEADVAKNTVIRNGMIYHKLTKELYKQHKADGWTDRRIRDRYGMYIKQLTEWKKDNFTKEEIDEMSLTGLHSKKPKEGGEKVSDQEIKNGIEAAEKHIEELTTEKQLAYQKSKELETELLSVKDQNINLDYENENLKQKVKELQSENQQLMLRIEELKRIANPLRELVKVIL